MVIGMKERETLGLGLFLPRERSRDTIPPKWILQISLPLNLKKPELLFRISFYSIQEKPSIMQISLMERNGYHRYT